MITLHDKIRNCKQCPLWGQMPEGCKPVPGVGPITAKLMLVGEALGEDESIIGKPFIGQCGRLLDKMLCEAGIPRDSVYITNVVKCRPTKTSGRRVSNRPPAKTEIHACRPWLDEEIALVNPGVIFTLGMVPTRELLTLKSTAKLGDYVGNSHLIGVREVVPLYHPSYVMVHSKKDYDTCVAIFKKYSL